MGKYENCVLRHNLSGAKTGDFICYGLDECLCKTSDHCPFYAPSDTHFRDPKTGYVHRKRKGKKNNEKIYF